MILERLCYWAPLLWEATDDIGRSNEFESRLNILNYVNEQTYKFINPKGSLACKPTAH